MSMDTEWKWTLGIEIPQEISTISATSAKSAAPHVEHFVDATFKTSQFFWYLTNRDLNDPTTLHDYQNELNQIFPEIPGMTSRDRVHTQKAIVQHWRAANIAMLQLLNRIYMHVPSHVDIITKHGANQTSDMLCGLRAYREIQALDGVPSNHLIATLQKKYKAIRYDGDWRRHVPRLVVKLHELQFWGALPASLEGPFIGLIADLEGSNFGQKDLNEHVKRFRSSNEKTWNTKTITIQDFIDFHDEMVTVLSATGCPIVTDEASRPSKRSRNDIEPKGPCKVCLKIQGLPDRITISHNTEDHDDNMISQKVKRRISDNNGRSILRPNGRGRGCSRGLGRAGGPTAPNPSMRSLKKRIRTTCARAKKPLNLDAGKASENESNMAENLSDKAADEILAALSEACEADVPGIKSRNVGVTP